MIKFKEQHESMIDKKAVIILSGGMDSGVLMRTSLPKYDEVVALSFAYGSNHSKQELKCALKMCRHYGVRHKIIELPFIKQHFKSTLLSGAKDIPEGRYDEEIMRSTVVPFRNGIMLAVAVGYAESIGAQHVLIGNHAGDHFIYPDCRTSFIQAFNEAAQHGTFEGVQVLSPFCALSKKDIASLGQAIGFNFELTYSCYKGGREHCGKCGSCTERKEALEGFDPTVYKKGR